MLIGPDTLGHDTLAGHNSRGFVTTSKLVLGIEETGSSVVMLRSINPITHVRITQIAQSAMGSELFVLPGTQAPPDPKQSC